MDNPEINKKANNGFSPLACWEMLKIEQDAPGLENELEVDGIKYCSPTVPLEEFERTGEGGGGQKKYNFGERFDRPAHSKEVLYPNFTNQGKLARDKEANDPLYEKKVTN